MMNAYKTYDKHIPLVNYTIHTYISQTIIHSNMSIYIHKRRYIHIVTYKHTYIHTDIHTYIHTNLHAYIHTYKYNHSCIHYE